MDDRTEDTVSSGALLDSNCKPQLSTLTGGGLQQGFMQPWP